jgi:NTP pyrophosphatase (non-canonical NTP hydrolase)
MTDYKDGDLTFDHYQKFCRTTAVYPREQALDYLIHGLTSEAGEVAGKRKKQLRDGNVSNSQILAEVGDVLWYVAEICSLFDLPLSGLAAINMAKLDQRKQDGKLHGSGDNR